MRRGHGLLVSCLILIAAPPARASKAVDGVVNINTAEVGVLGLLPGIGPAKAAQIVVYRRRHPFRTVDELVRIKGIGRKMVRRLRAHLAVSGPTTATGAVAPSAAAVPPPPCPAAAPAAPGAPTRRRACAMRGKARPATRGALHARRLFAPALAALGCFRCVAVTLRHRLQNGRAVASADSASPTATTPCRSGSSGARSGSRDASLRRRARRGRARPKPSSARCVASGTPSRRRAAPTGSVAIARPVGWRQVISTSSGITQRWTPTPAAASSSTSTANTPPHCRGGR